MHLEYGQYITAGEIKKHVEKMTRKEDEFGLLMIEATVEFLELMVYANGVYSSFEMYDLDGDKLI